MRKHRRGPYERIFRYVYLKLTRKNDSPERIGRGAGLGIFIGIFPTLWFGPALAIAGAGLLGANRAAALLGSFVCGPLTPFTWTLALLLGNWMVAPEWRISAHLLRFEHRSEIFERFFITFLAGNIAISILFGLAGYAVVWWLAARRHRTVQARRAALAAVNANRSE
jgi:uncharacterized protein (DUF2062 family)